MVDSFRGLIYLGENLSNGQDIQIVSSDYTGAQQTVVFAEDYGTPYNGIDAMTVYEETGKLIVEISTFASASSNPTHLYEIDPDSGTTSTTIFAYPDSLGTGSTNSFFEHPIAIDYSRQKLLSLNRNTGGTPSAHLRLTVSNLDGSSTESIYDENAQPFSSGQYPYTVLSFDISRTLKSLAQIAYELDQNLDLSFSGSFYLNWGGANEKWILSNGSVWHFITPDGRFFRWNNGAPGANFLSSSTLVATLDASYYSSPENLYEAPFYGSLAELAVLLDETLALYSAGNYFENWGGLGEKWINSTSGTWYYITPAGALYRWFGGDVSNAEKVADFDLTYFAVPSTLHDAAAS